MTEPNPAVAVVPTSSTKKKPTESDVYDRQIRLWGAEAQKKMQNSKVLYIHITGGSSEVLKNLCLAGIKAEICDPRPAKALDSAPCFFTHPNNNNNTSSPSSNKKLKFGSVAHAVKPLVEELNPLLGSCPVVEKEVEALTGEDLKDYAVVVASRIPIEEAVRLFWGWLLEGVGVEFGGPRKLEKKISFGQFY